MGKTTGISWCDHTFNGWRGCTKVSAGCENCYAEAGSKRNPAVLGVWGPAGTRVVASETMWREPEKWNREAERDGVRRRVFCASLADVFEDWRGPMVDSRGNQLFADGDGWFCPGKDCFAMSQDTTMDDVRSRLFRLIDATPHLDWLLLTKRPENIRRMLPAVEVSSQQQADDCNERGELYRRNVWLGTSVENQETADKRIPELLKCHHFSDVLFLSCEPLLGPVDFSAIQTARDVDVDALRGVYRQWCDEGIDHPAMDQFHDGGPKINWVIVGGESGPHFRPMNLDWARSIRDQCAAAGVPFFYKQSSGVHPRKDGTLDGVAMRQFPYGRSKP